MSVNLANFKQILANKRLVNSKNRIEQDAIEELQRANPRTAPAF